MLFVPRLDARGSVADFGTVFALGGAGAKGVIVVSGRPASIWDRLRQDPDELKPAVAAAWPVWTADPTRPRPPGWFAFRPFLQLWNGRFETFAQSIVNSAWRMFPVPTWCWPSARLLIR